MSKLKHQEHRQIQWTHTTSTHLESTVGKWLLETEHRRNPSNGPRNLNQRVISWYSITTITGSRGHQSFSWVPSQEITKDKKNTYSSEQTKKTRHIQAKPEIAESSGFRRQISAPSRHPGVRGVNWRGVEPRRGCSQPTGLKPIWRQGN